MPARDRHGWARGRDRRNLSAACVLLHESKPWDLAMERQAADRMVQRQIAARGIQDERVLAAMRDVPRHAFVDEGLQEFA